MNHTRIALAALALPALVGCAAMGGAYTANMASQKVQPTTLMTAKKVQRKLFVVVDPAKVKDSFQLSNSPHSVAGFHSFFKASLNEALVGEFDSVEFVAPGFSAPSDPHLVADVKVDGSNLVVSSKEVAQPVAVRYAYTNRPLGVYLYNSAGLPASPFTTAAEEHDR